MPIATGKKIFGILRAASAITAVAALFIFAAPVLSPAQETTLGKAHVKLLAAQAGVKKLATGKVVKLKDKRLGPLNLETTINPRLQKKAEQLLLKLKDPKAAIVVTESATGKVLALAGVHKRRISPQMALNAGGPAASLFKVITAAAALEETQLKPNSQLKFAGRPHTLYRYQLKEKTRRRETKITLKKSFAQSNNPVFARLGVHELGGERLVSYAHALGFERNLGLEVPVQISRLAKLKTSFDVGEMACGFDRETTMSPLHAAAMVSVFTNGGRFVEPYLVKRVTGAAGEVLYVGRPVNSASLFSPNTCKLMRSMFEATVKTGTARKAFRRLNRDKVLKNLKVGGKTGTLRTQNRKELYQWFAGYGRDPQTGKALSVAAMVAHGKTRWGNPKTLARTVLRDAFQVHLTWGEPYCEERRGDEAEPAG